MIHNLLTGMDYGLFYIGAALAGGYLAHVRDAHGDRIVSALRGLPADQLSEGNK